MKSELAVDRCERDQDDRSNLRYAKSFYRKLSGLGTLTPWEVDPNVEAFAGSSGSGRRGVVNGEISYMFYRQQQLVAWIEAKVGSVGSSSGKRVAATRMTVLALHDKSVAPYLEYVLAQAMKKGVLVVSDHWSNMEVRSWDKVAKARGAQILWTFNSDDRWNSKVPDDLIRYNHDDEKAKRAIYKLMVPKSRMDLFSKESILDDMAVMELNGFERAFYELGLSKSDAALYNSWVFDGVFSPRAAAAAEYLGMFQRLRKALPPEAIDEIPSTVYRGMRVSRPVGQAIAAGRASLQARVLTSWTGSKSAAKAYAETGENKWRMVLQTSPDRPVIRIGPKLIAWIQRTPDTVHANKDEVILKGNGVNRITEANIVYLHDETDRNVKMK